MKLTPRRIHGTVGAALSLAEQGEWLHSRPSHRHPSSNVWFILLPEVIGLDTVGAGETVEVARKLSVRVGRSGVRGWSMTAIDTTATRFSERVPPQELVFDGRETFEAITRATEATPTLTSKMVYRLAWGKEGVRYASRRHQMYDHLVGGTSEMPSDADVLARLDASFIGAELDTEEFSGEDLDKLYEDIAEHAEFAMASPETRATEHVNRWLGGAPAAFPRLPQ